MREKDTIERINALPNGIGGATWVGCSNMGTQTFTTDELKSLTAELADARARIEELEADVKRLTEWRLALESFTPTGSEYVNDLPRCVEFVRQKFTERHEAKKDVVRLKRALGRE